MQKAFPSTILKTWHKKFCSQEESFQIINQILRNYCTHLRNEVNPLQTILITTNFTLPLYYALCNEVPGKNPAEIAKGLCKLHKPVKKILSNVTELPEVAKRLTFDTIFYCAFHACPLQTREGCFLKFIGMGWSRATNMLELVEYVQRRYFPIVKGIENLYAWDPIMEKWLVVHGEKELKFVFEEAYHQITHFEGFSQRPNQICFDTLVTDLRNRLQKEDKIESSLLPKTCRELHKVYGHRQVPEYYFFNLNLKFDDEIDVSNKKKK